MSAIAKPLIHTDGTDAGVDGAVVNAENVHGVSKVDAPSIGDNGKTKYKILFSILGTDNQLKEVEWVYSTVATPQVTRDAIYLAVKAAVSLAIV